MLTLKATSIHALEALCKSPPFRDKSYSSGRRRLLFFSPWRFLASSLRLCAARPGRVFLRLGGGGFNAWARMAARRSWQSSRFRPCVRWRSEFTTSTPVAVKRDTSRFSNIARCPSLSVPLRATSKRISTRVLTLFTCWPPAPELREKDTLNSAIGIDSVLVISNRSIHIISTIDSLHQIN